jgi:CBS domain-containing protein
MLTITLQAKKQVYQVHDEQTALEAFTLIDEKRLSGIAVVDKETKRLIGKVQRRIILSTV